MKKYLRLIVVMLAFYHPLAMAHSREAAGFISGFLHPLFGPDHLLAMLGVGIISARIDGHYIWSIPGLFVLFMVLGGILGANGILFPMVEWGIALSVLVLGIAIIVVKRANISLLMVVMLFVAFFGFLHGHAHGVEMPDSISPYYYSFGFVISTSLIHILGVLIGHFSTKRQRLEKMPSYVGGFMAVAGCLILYGLTQS
ncbi:HupE/UreJ family protein [Exilibacterium tricleocarpae]|nr:HupE/UreJ family protein [Exilibacterium tricleocarpae]